MVNVRCSRYDGYCYPCFAYSFPDDARAKRRIKVKEVALYKYLRATFPEVDITWDKAPQDGCTRRRPDLVIDLGYVVLVIECDEHAHRSIGYSCETKREMQLLDAYKRPLVMFRFNPDSYVDAEGVRHKSCFSVRKGAVTLCKKEWSHRTAALAKLVKQYLEQSQNTVMRSFTRHQLFYDE